MTFTYPIPSDDFSRAGYASAEMKKKLQQLGLPSNIIKKASIAMYEAEINMVVHAGGGEASIEITETEITMIMKDHGPGIPDIEKAMQEGYSTAPQTIQELGFGAGMGLPNMKRNSDYLNIESEVGKGTTVTMKIKIGDAQNE